MEQQNVFWNIVKALLTLQLFIMALFFAISFKPLPGQKIWSEFQAERWLTPFHQIAMNEYQAEYLLHETSCALVKPSYPSFDIWSKKLGERLLAHEILVLAHDYEDDAPSLPIQSITPSPVKPIQPEEESPPAKISPIAETEAKNHVLTSGLKDKIVVLYATHNGETYTPDSGIARLNQKAGLIHEVGKSLAADFVNSGMPAKFIDTIHDLDYNSSYTNSRKTVNTILEEYPGKLAALFDIHRDSIPGEKKGATIRINGKEAAQLLIIVGTDERKSHPHWQENMDFAERIYQKAQIKYPGLIKGVRTKAGTYNQEYFNHSLLIECGTDQNELQEVVNSMHFFVEIVLEVLQEEAAN